MSQAESGERVEFTVTEHIEGNGVMWTARAGREPIAQVTQRLYGSTCDSGELIDAIAEHYRVERDAVTFDSKRRRRNEPFRYVPKRGWVQLPAKPGTCNHRSDQDACDLPACGGAPVFPVTLDRNVETLAGAQARGSESGVVTVGRELTAMIERLTGLRTSGLRFADNGYSDMRQGARKLHGWEFQVDDDHGPMHVQVLVYEAKRALDTYARRHGAVYVGAARIVADLDLEGPHTKWMPDVARHLVPIVQDMHDAVELANERPDNGRWSLKSPPPGHLVGHATGLAVVKKSRVGGTTLLVQDLLGREHFVDREPAGWWQVFPAARDARGDTFARFEQRMAWRRRLVRHMHNTSQHDGRPGDCRPCLTDVMGAQDAHGHHFGRNVVAPWCWFCGSRPGSPEAAQDCPKLPKRLPADYQRAAAQLERAAAGGEPTAEPVADDLARRAQEFAASVDRTDGELDAAIDANNANPTPENRARVMAAARRHVASFQADERAELMAKQYGPRPAAEPEPEAFGSAAKVYAVGDRVRVRVGHREASGRVTVVEQVGCDRVYEVLRAGLGSICVGAEQMRPDPTPTPEVGQTWVCDAIGATVTVRAVHDDGLTADTERGSVILAAPDWRPAPTPEPEPVNFQPDLWGDVFDRLGV